MTSPTPAYVLNNNNKSENYYRNFKQSIKSIETFNTYDHKLKAFMKYKQIGNIANLIEDKDTRTIESDIIDFLISLKEKHYSLSSQEIYLSALIHFYTINDVMVRRKKIAKFLSNDDRISVTSSNGHSEGQGNNDKPYTHAQIAKLLEFSDLREKAIILLMASSGMRIGALPMLKISDLTPIETHQIYQVRVYANSKSNRHFTFCTPEARKTIDNYLDYRRNAGEKIQAKSPLFRSDFDMRDTLQAANNVKPLPRNSIKTSLRQVLYASGVRTPLVKVKDTLNYRRDIATSHSFRKFFDTNATHAGMNPIYIDWCLGHSLKGVKDSYFLPQPDADGIYSEILEGNEKSYGYLAAMPSLTIDESNRLRRENEMLRIKKSEIEALKEQAAEYQIFKSRVSSEAKKTYDKLELIEKKVRERLGIK